MKFNLENLVLEYEQLEQELSNPEIFKDQKKVREVSSRKKQRSLFLFTYFNCTVSNSGKNQEFF